MTQRSRRALAMLLGLIVAALPVAAESPAALDRLISAGVADNPHLAALRRRIEATEATVRQAGSLPDPQAQVALTNLPAGDLSLERTPMSGIQLGLHQMLPYPGRLDLRELAARQDVVITRALYEESENALIRQIRHSWNELYYLHQAVEVTRLNKQIAEALVEVAEALYSVGRRPQQDLVQANVQVARLVERLIVLEERLGRAEAGLNALLDRPPDAPVPEAMLSLEPLELSAQALLDVARQDRPMVREGRARVERAETMVALAQMNMKPDFNVGLSYRVRARSAMDSTGGQDFWSLSVGANLPWLNRDLHEAEEDEQRARLAQARERLRDTLSRVREALDNALEAMERSRREAQLYEEGLIPEAELAFEAARSAYESGAVDLLTLLDAFRTLNSYQEAYYRAIADHENAVADLEFVIGQRLR
ncbi:MAG: TolC family protein [Armatimonadota bacterium]